MNSTEKAILGIVFVIAMILPLFSWMNSQLVDVGAQSNSTGLMTFIAGWGPYFLIFILISGIGAALWKMYESVN